MKILLAYRFALWSESMVLCPVNLAIQSSDARPSLARPHMLLRMYAWGNVSDFSGSEMTAGAAGQAWAGLPGKRSCLGADGQSNQRIMLIQSCR